MESSQLELWNDTPTPWKKRMEDDAFAIAFPDDERVEGDRVEIDWYYEHCTGGYCPTCHTHNESDFRCTVIWCGPPIGLFERGPGRRVGDPSFTRYRVYRRGEAAQFWKQLMQRGSK